MNFSNDILKEIDAATRESILKAAEVVGTYPFSPQARSVFAPENITADIKLLVPTETPIRNRLPRVQGMGQASVFKKLTSRLHSNTGGGGIGTNTSVAFADAGKPNATSQTFATVAFPYKLLGRSVEVGGLAIAATQGGTGPGSDMLTAREKTKAVEVMLGEEELIIGGDVNTDANQFDGMGKQITTNSGNAALLSASGIGAFCNTVYLGGGDPTVLIDNARQSQAIADALSATGSIQRAVIGNQGGVIAGYRVEQILNPITGTLIDLETSRYVGGNAFLLTEKSAAGENWVQVEELIPMSRVDVPSSNFSQIRFVLEAEVLDVIGEPFQLVIGGLSLS